MIVLFPVIGQNPGGFFKSRTEFAIGEQLPVFRGFPQRRQAAVVVQHGIRVVLLGGHIDVPVVVVDLEPGGAGGEAGVGGRIPLHGGSGVVPAHFLAGGQGLLFGQSRIQSHPVLILGVDVVEFLDAAPVGIGHTDFLTLVNKGNAPQEQAHRTQHFLAHGIAGIVRQEPGDSPRLIMVFDDVRLEADSLGFQLRLENHVPPLGKIDIRSIVPAVGSVAENVGAEIEHGRKISVVTNKASQFLRLHVEHLRHGEGIVLGKGMGFQICQEISHALHAVHHLGAHGQAVRAVRRIVREGQILFDIDDGVDPEARKALVQPPVHHVVELLPHHRIFPVQIRLLLGKHMEIVFVRAGHRLPAAAAEIGAQIAGRIAVFAPAEIEVVRVLSLWVGQSLSEPFVLIGAVVDDQIHDDVHIPLFRLVQQLVKLLHGAELPGNAVIVGDVIALIGKGRGIDGRQPENVNAQAFQIIQLGQNSCQIADAVTVGVEKALGINLIGNLVVPPLFFHRECPFLLRSFDKCIILRLSSKFLHSFCIL